MLGDDELTLGREAAERLAWSDAYNLLSRSHVQSGEDLELLATAAYLMGHVEECREALQRAQQAHADDGDRRRGARCLFWVGFTLLLEGELAPATGWLARTQRILDDDPSDCAEAGLMLIPTALQALAMGDVVSAEADAARAAALGARFEDADLLTLALHFQGLATVSQGRVQAGLILLDEAMVAVVSGEVWAPVAGHIYCSMINACQELWDLRRADEWTAALEKWWRLQPDMLTFSGQCLIHRAEIMQRHGAWPEAVEEAKRACERLTHAADKHASGAAWYRLGEIFRVRGDLATAEDAYRHATEWGHDAQPGLALLRLAVGKRDVAEHAIRRLADETTDPLRRAKVLPALIEIMLAVGDTATARAAAVELTDLAEENDSPAMRAAAGGSIGAVLLAEGDARSALVELRRAWSLWRDLDAPYEAARLRVLVGLGCRAQGDEESAELELTSASRVFEGLGAAADAASVQRLAQALGTDTHGLTPRELQVLRQLARGMTNQAIADQLVLSHKTVDRHVTNIFAKLGVASRAAATAYAYDHRLL